ncbi:MAG: hypothetical protein ACYTF8_02545 [Planctomycetota bacterium]|jgi:predicted amidohydrolase YtcJ
MTAKLTIAFSDEVLEALRASKSITIRLEGSRGRSGSGGSDEPRAGSLPARLIEWAKTKKKAFGTRDVSKRFRLSRAHSSMLLSRLANGPYPIQRERRGVYIYAR